MSKEIVFSNEHSIMKVDKEIPIEEIQTLNNKIIQLTNENEDYKQQTYDLRRKLETEQKLNKELTDDHEYSLNQLEQTLRREIKDITEKYNAEREEYKSDIEKLESTLSETQREILRLNNEINNIRFETSNNENQISILQPSTSIEENIKNEHKIKELAIHLEDEMEKNEKLKQNLVSMTSEIQNLKEMLNISKQKAEEKSQLLESVREDLILCQTELNSFKNNPETNVKKGNSVFAELEDSRNKIIKQMNILQSNYQEMKRHYKILESENAQIKSDKHKLMKEWNEESYKILVQHKEVDKSYNDTIQNLQQNLKIERTKQRLLIEKMLQYPNISFLQIQMAEQKKEADKLRSQMECDYYQKCIIQQKMEKLLKEVKFWKYKALANEDSKEVQGTLNKDVPKRELSDEDKTVDKENELCLKRARTSFINDSVEINVSHKSDFSHIKTVKFHTNEESFGKENISLTSTKNNSTLTEINVSHKSDLSHVKRVKFHTIKESFGKENISLTSTQNSSTLTDNESTSENKCDSKISNTNDNLTCKLKTQKKYPIIFISSQTK